MDKRGTETDVPESMLQRMAGPSSAKAGFDDSRTASVNRIIHDASKGGKYYANELRKDRQLTEKIKEMLKYRDELLARPSTDLPALERIVDKALVDLEASERDLSQYIVHCDLDAFYASCEELWDPTLKGTAFGVGSGVLVTASCASSLPLSIKQER